MRKREKKIKKIIKDVNIHVQATFNNTIITATDKVGNVVAWESAGSAGFKNSRESTPFAAQAAAEGLMKKLKAMGVVNINIFMKGIGSGREAVLKHVQDFHVHEIRECTPMRHNGTRLPKRRKN